MIEENKNKSKKTCATNQSRKENNSIKYFSFWDTICVRSCIYNSLKRKFIKIATELIDNKLSVEYFLQVSNNVELLKKLTLNDEQNEKFDNMVYLPLKEQLNEFKIKDS